MDVLHSFMNDKKLKSKLTSKTDFSHMYKTSDKVGGTIHSKLPKMTMPKYVMPKISYNVPKYSSPKKNSFNTQNLKFSSLIRRDTHSHNETSSAPTQAHITGSTPSLNSLNNTFSNVINAAKGPADPNITQGPVKSDIGAYGMKFKNLQVEALTDTQAKSLLPSIAAQLAAGLTPDIVTQKQLEPYMKIGAVQYKPTDITASGISSSRVTKGTGYIGPGDPGYVPAGPIHDLGISQPMFNYFQPGLTMGASMPNMLPNKLAGNTANITAVTNQAIATPINIQDNIQTAISSPTPTPTSSGGSSGSGRSSSSSRTTTPTPVKVTPATPAPAPKAITVPSSEKFLPNPSGNAAKNISAIDKAASSGSGAKAGGGTPTFAPAPKPTFVQKVVNIAKSIFGKK